MIGVFGSIAAMAVTGMAIGIMGLPPSIGVPVIIGLGIVTAVFGFGMLAVMIYNFAAMPREAQELADVRDCGFALRALLKQPDRAFVVFMRALDMPSGSMRLNRRYLDGDTARRMAAEGLGRLKNPLGVGPLITLLAHEDVVLRARAAWSLGESGGETAVAALIARLGGDDSVMEKPERLAMRKLGASADLQSAVDRTLEGIGGRRLCDLAAEALEKLNAGQHARTFERVLNGQESATSVTGHYAEEFRRALINALNSASFTRVAGAATALADLGCSETLPLIRVALRRLALELPDGAQLARAIEKLEGLAQLPRVASATPSVEDLPRPVVPTNAPETKDLPRAVGDEPMIRLH